MHNEFLFSFPACAENRACVTEVRKLQVSETHGAAPLRFQNSARDLFFVNSYVQRGSCHSSSS
jgi:hypothetical protein